MDVGVSPKPYSEVVNRDVVCVAPHEGSSKDKQVAQNLVLEYLRIAEKGGSDVRLDIGIPYRASAWPRSSAKTYLWKWEIVHGYKWRQSEGVHINKLELLACLSTFKWRLRSASQFRSRFIHLTDSQVCGSICTKGRSSSKILRTTIQKLSALTLAGTVVCRMEYHTYAARRAW